MNSVKAVAGERKGARPSGVRNGYRGTNFSMPVIVHTLLLSLTITHLTEAGHSTLGSITVTQVKQQRHNLNPVCPTPIPKRMALKLCHTSTLPGSIYSKKNADSQIH